MMIVRLEPFQHQVPENEKGEKGKKKTIISSSTTKHDTNLPSRGL